MRYSPIPSRLFSDRRNEFIKKMKKGTIAIFYSNDFMTRSGDQYFPYRQDPALFSLSGIDQPGTILVLYPGAKKKMFRELLFILPHDPDHAVWNGDRLTKKQASKISAVETVYETDRWQSLMPDLISSAKGVYLNIPEKEKPKSIALNANEKKAIELKDQFPKLTFLSAESILTDTSMVKHKVEIDMIRKAVNITAEAFIRVLHTIKPGMKEYEVEAELSYILTKHGSRHAFEPIIASGKSACTLHYITNDKTIEAGSLVLIDFGAEYSNIASDMTRTIPASGKFSRQQKKIYLAVMRVLNEVTGLMQPGVTLEELNREAGKVIESELIRLNILSKRDVKKQDVKKPLWKKYFMHGVSHHLGYDVHDLSDRSAPLKPGMVLTCEPGIYIPELGMGIRLENDILITKKGQENLMASVPIHPDEIETIMQSKT